MSFPLTIATGKEYSHITHEEAVRIWNSAKLPEVRLFLKVLWFTGLRIGEALSLTVRDLVKVENGYDLIVTREKKKTPRPETLPIPLELGTLLDDYWKAKGMKRSDKFFPGHENAYRYQVKQCAKRAGLENWQKIHPHLFRHGFVYQKVLDKVHLMVLSKLVGHSNLNTTLGYYQPTTEDLRAAINK